MNVLSWSGGKDSTATLILAHELGIKIDVAVISLPMFDISRKIYADSPEHIDWLFSKAIPTIEKWGTHVKVVSSDKDYLYWFKHLIQKSDKPERIGKMYGWLIGGHCRMNRSKVDPIKRYMRSIPEPYTRIVGICIDEPERLTRMEKRGQCSLLADYKITTRQARAMCEQYGKRYEFIIYANKGRAPFMDGMPRYDDIWRYARVSGGGQIHQNQKPTDLLSRIIRQHTRERDLILDPFMGSFATAVAAYKLQRDFIGFEIDDDYYAAGSQWLDTTMSQVSIFDLLQQN